MSELPREDKEAPKRRRLNADAVIRKAEAKLEKAKAEKAAKAPAKAKTSEKDDLKKIEGIGPKIAELLNAAGIFTFAELAGAKIATLQGVLDAAGSRYKMHDPGTWAKQAKLATDGNWEKLAAWQEELKGGKK
jgi:predicted flap endonuclease-1-like 5' DNA nuclease